MEPDQSASPAKVNLLQILAVACLVICFYFPLLSGGSLTGGDFANLFWPMREYTFQTVWQQGIFPLWNHYTFMGTPHAATMQHGVFYPVNYLIYLIPPFIAETKLDILFHLILTGVGVWFFLRYVIKTSIPMAVTLGALFPCISWFWTNGDNLARMAGVSYIPWIFAILALFLAGKMKGVSFLFWHTVLLTLAFVTGHPQAFFYTLMLEGFFFACSVIIWPKNWKRILPQLGLILLSYVLCGCLSAVQLLMSLELSPFSYREFQRLDPSYGLGVSLKPDMLFHLMNPNLFHAYTEGSNPHQYSEFHFFMGRLILILSLPALVITFLKSKRFGILSLLFLGFAILFMLGGNASVERITNGDFSTFPSGAVADAIHYESSELMSLSFHEALSKILPPLQGFRAPVRLNYHFLLGIFLLIGFGFSRLEIKLKHQWIIWPVVFVIGFAELFLASNHYAFRETESHPSVDYDGSTLTFLDRNFPANSGRIFRLTLEDDARIQASLSDDPLVRVESFDQRFVTYQENLNVLGKLPSVYGYEEGLIPTIRTKDFLFRFNRHLRSPEPDPVLLRLMGIRFYLSDLPVEGALQPVGSLDSLMTVYQFPLESQAFYQSQVSGVDWQQLEGTYWRNEGLTGSRNTSLINYGMNPTFDSSIPVPMTLSESANTLEIIGADSAQGDVLVSMGYMPGWVVNGEPVEWINAIHAKVPTEAFEAGTATLSYEPRSFRLGLFITVCTAFLLSFLFFLRKKGVPHETQN